MPISTISPGAFHCLYDPATQLLRGQWTGPVADARLRAQYSELITAAQTHRNCRCWLLDMRARNWHSPEFGHWFGSVFAEAAHAALHLPLFIAYVLSPDHHAIADTPSVQATQRGCSEHDLYPFFFDSEAAAYEWLRHQQAHE